MTLFPLFVGHGQFLILDQRAEGRGIDGLAAVDAGLDGFEQRAGLVEFGPPGVERRQLGVDQRAEVEPPAAGQLGDLRQGQAGPLERDDLVDPLELARPV